MANFHQLKCDTLGKLRRDAKILLSNRFCGNGTWDTANPRDREKTYRYKVEGI